MRYITMAVCAGLAACATQGDRTDSQSPGAEAPAPVEEEYAYEDYGEPSPIPSKPRETPDYHIPGAPMVGSGAPTAAGGSGSPVVTRDFLPFIDVAIDQEAANSRWGLPLEDLYTRIRIVTLDPAATDMEGVASGRLTAKSPERNYKDESRGWLSRMMGSKSVSRALLAEFDILKPDVKATEALFSASFTSNREQGESWSTDQSLALYATPWFKVTSNTTVTAKLRMQLSDERESSNVSANVMSSLTSAANLLAPTSSLLTMFTAPSMLEASNFLDNSVSTLFGRSITEQTMSSMSIKTWSEDPILVVYAALPDTRDIRNTDDREMLGGWAVYLDAPIVSVFTSATQPDEYGNDLWPEYRGVAGADILAFKVGEELTVYDYVFSRLDLFDRITSLNEAPDPDLARLICTRIERGLSEIGFNAADSAAGVWAAATSDQFNAATASLIMQPQTCAASERWAKLNGVVWETQPVDPVYDGEEEAPY